MHVNPALTYLKNYLHPSVSYAQKREDLVVDHLFGSIDRFIDIGANDGISGSNTFKFALAGASGLCFEPVKSIFKKLNNLYLLNRKVKCINEGVSDKINKYEIRMDGVLSTIIETEDPVNKVCLKDYMNLESETTTINVRDLDSFLNIWPEFYKSDLISIDVEGHELNVVRGIDFEKISAKCIILESLGGKTTNYAAIEELLVKNNMIPALTNQLNTFFINKSVLKMPDIYSVGKVFNEYEIITY